MSQIKTVLQFRDFKSCQVKSQVAQGSCWESKIENRFVFEGFQEIPWGYHVCVWIGSVMIWAFATPLWGIPT